MEGDLIIVMFALQAKLNACLDNGVSNSINSGDKRALKCETFSLYLSIYVFECVSVSLFLSLWTESVVCKGCWCRVVY